MLDSLGHVSLVWFSTPTKFTAYIYKVLQISYISLGLPILLITVHPKLMALKPTSGYVAYILKRIINVTKMIGLDFI